jgi:hypothetical protein
MPVRIDGVVLLDKPAGMSSQGAVTAVKRAFNAEKAGYERKVLLSNSIVEDEPKLTCFLRLAIKR